MGDSGPGLVTVLGKVLQVCQWFYLSEGKAHSLAYGRLPATYEESGRGRRQEDAWVGVGGWGQQVDSRKGLASQGAFN